MGARTRIVLPALCAAALSLALPALARAASEPLTVARAGAGTGTVSSFPAGIECGAACTATFPEGQTVTLSASPGPHTAPAQWSGCDSIAAEDRCVVAIGGPRSVTATFELEQVQLSVSRAGAGTGTLTSSPAGIECGGSCSALFPYGTILALTAEPAPGSAFLRWSAASCATSPVCAIPLKRDRAIEAVFALAGTRTLTVARAGSGQGAVKGKAAGIECGQTCASQVKAGRRLALTAKPAKGSVFAGWSGACSGTARTCRLTMSEARQITATFEQPSPPPAAARGRLKLAAAARVRGPRALLRASCPPAAPCAGTLRLSARLPRGKQRARRRPIGRASFELPAGTSRILAVRLRPAGRRALARSGALRARAAGAGLAARWLKLRL